MNMTQKEYDQFFLKVCMGVVIALFVWVGGYQYGLSKFDTEVKVDTLHVRDTVWRSKPTLVDSETVKVVAPVDTDAIIQAYFSRNVFRDTLILKEYGTITLTDTVFENRIWGRQFAYDLSIPTYTAVKRSNFNVGVGIFGQRDSYGLIGSVKVKHWMVSGGYDFRNKVPHVGVQYIFGK